MYNSTRRRIEPSNFESPVLYVLYKLFNDSYASTYSQFFQSNSFPDLVLRISPERIQYITFMEPDKLTKTISDTNNLICYEFLKNKYPYIFNVPFNTQQDKNNVLNLLFTKVIFNMNANQIMKECYQEVPFLNQFFFTYDYFFTLIDKLFIIKIKYNPNKIQQAYNYIKLRNDFIFILDAIKGNLFEEQNIIFYLIQIRIILNQSKGNLNQNQLLFHQRQAEDPICLYLSNMSIIKYCNSIDSIFNQGIFQELVCNFLGANSIPGLIEQKNEFDIIRNNLVAFKFLSQKKKKFVQPGQKITTTEDRFNLLKSIILQIDPVEENKIIEMYNYYMHHDFHIKDVNFLYSPDCFFRYFLLAIQYCQIDMYDGIPFLYFDQTVESIINELVDNYQYTSVPVFIRSCFYKDEKYKFLILIQYCYLTDLIINGQNYMDNDIQDSFSNLAGIYDDQPMCCDQEVEKERQIFEEEQLHRMRNEERRKNKIKVLRFNDKMLYNSHKYDYDNYFFSDNPFFHYKRKGIHTTDNLERHIIPKTESCEYMYGLIDQNKKDEIEPENSFDSDEFDYSSDDDKIDDNNDRIDDNDNDSFHDITNNMLLKTINTLCENSDLHFDDFYQAAKNDSIPKFVMTILNLKKIKKVSIKDKKKHSHHKSKKLSESEIENIKAVVRYLQNKEPRFLTLVFDFTKENLVESSSILFYSKFLNLFFLKETKENLLKRCIKILSIEKVNKNIILTNFDTYYSLVYYVEHGKVKKIIYKKDKHKEKTFKKAKIPCLIDKEFLQKCRSKNELPDVLYYQLQLIFNALDVKQPPPSPTTTTTEDIPEIQINEINYPLTFRERLKLYKVQLNNDDSNQNAKSTNTKLLSEEKYWNLTDKKSFIDDGVIAYTKENKKMENEWESSIKKKEETTTKAKESKFKLKKKKKLFNDNEFKTKEKLKPFKLFVYNEKNAKWFFNKEEFSAFCKNSSLDSNETPTPLILYMNSFEKDLITINSNFINHPYPDLKDETNQIYVYAFCDRNLSYLSYQIDTEESSKTKPIFLLLHVPESKKNHPNISKIVFQIFSFLSYICDIEIFVLNKKHYKDQADFISNINKIFLKNDELSSRRKSSNFSKNYDDDQDSSESFNEDVVEEDDDDDYDNDESQEKQSSDDDDDSDDKLTDKIGDDFNEFKIFPKIPINPSKIIVLANDPDVHEDVDEYDTFFFNTLLYGIKIEKEKKGLFKFHLININEAVTYRQFLESLKDFSIKSDTVFGEILQRFKLVPMSDISNAFIQIKIKKSWQKELRELILNRYLMYEEKSIQPSVILSHIVNELTKIASHYDLEFYNECSSSFLDIKKKLDKNREIITYELEKSSLKNINDMKKINDYERLTKRTNDNLQKSHFNFLRKEYFDIVKFISSSKDFGSYYENNLDILDGFIKNGINEIINLRKNVKGDFKDKLSSKDEDDYINGSTNYEIRQKENVKEMKIQISLEGDLTDEIDQDF